MTSTSKDFSPIPKTEQERFLTDAKVTGSGQSIVTIQEIVPSDKRIRRPKSHTQDRKTPKNVRKYYQKQEELLALLSDNSETLENDENSHVEQTASSSGLAARAAMISLAFNLLLLVAKAFASYFSGSLSIISSLVDSSIDLVSGIIIWLTNRSIKVTNFYHYPVGKTRLEPLAITILSVVMAVASVQLLIESIQALVKGSIELDVGIATIVILCSTITIKLCLFLYCRRYKKSPSVQALAQDHRNDFFSNTVALVMGYIGDRFWKPADPIGALLFGIYIAYGWSKIGWNQVKELSGHAAKPECLAKLLQVCCTFDSRILYIDTLTAYHFGTNLIVEAHIVLPPAMALQEAHDIGEPLQQKLATFSFVERAFVHIDYEYEHQPENEHARVNF